MIEELNRKLRTKALSNATLTNLIGTSGAYLAEAPQEQDYPYITFFPVDEVPIHFHGADAGNILNDTLYQFDLWSTTTIGLATLYSELTTTLDNANLSLSTITQVGLLRQPANALLIDHDSQAGRVFHQFVEYRIHVI